jgi:hypothetical protein
MLVGIAQWHLKDVVLPLHEMWVECASNLFDARRQARHKQKLVQFFHQSSNLFDARQAQTRSLLLHQSSISVMICPM